MKHLRTHTREKQTEKLVKCTLVKRRQKEYSNGNGLSIGYKSGRVLHDQALYISRGYRFQRKTKMQSYCVILWTADFLIKQGEGLHMGKLSIMLLVHSYAEEPYTLANTGQAVLLLCSQA